MITFLATPAFAPPSWSQMPLPTAGSSRAEGSGYKPAALNPDAHTAVTGELEVLTASSKNVAEQVFDNGALLKIEMSRRAMHLSGNVRAEINHRLDQILDPDDWEEDSSLVRPLSFVSFLRSIVADRISRVPYLGVSVGGDLLATWWNGSPDRSLFIRYYGDDQIEMIGSMNGETIKVMTVAGSLRQALLRNGFLEQMLDGEIAENTP